MMSWMDILTLVVLNTKSVRSFTTDEREVLRETLQLIADTATPELIEELQDAFDLLDTAQF